MKNTLTQDQWEIQMSEKILNFVHSELYLDLRYLELAFMALKPKTNPALSTFATDGIYLYYSPQQVLRVFQKNSKFLNRCMLHSVFHCIFLHLWLTPKNKQIRYWNLACDIIVEYTIDQLDKKSTKRILSWQRQKLYEKIKTSKNGISASIISISRVL